MLKPTGFWSYTSSDDEHSRGRLSQLRALLASELQQKIGRNPKVHLFQDVASIPPGQEWDKQIDEALAASCFLIAVITPGFLQSEWCMREVSLFRKREAALGRNDLIFPVHYNNIEHLDPDRLTDCYDKEIFAFLRSRQWTDFRSLRLRDPESEIVAEKLSDVADAICGTLRRTVQSLPPVLSPPPIVVPPPPTGVEADSPVEGDHTEVEITDHDGMVMTLLNPGISYPSGFGPSTRMDGIAVRRGSQEASLLWSRIRTLEFQSRQEKNEKGTLIWRHAVKATLSDGRASDVELKEDWNMAYMGGGGTGFISGQTDLGGTGVAFNKISVLRVIKFARPSQK